MQEIIEKLLQKQATIEADREAEKELACKEIDAKYDERAEKIDAMLNMAGYVKPVEETANESVEEQEKTACVSESEVVEDLASVLQENVKEPTVY